MNEHPDILFDRETKEVKSWGCKKCNWNGFNYNERCKCGRTRDQAKLLGSLMAYNEK